MEIDAQTLEQHARATFAELMWGNLLLTAQLGAAQKRLTTLEAELAELKKPKE